jgi:ADP-heptose:LPS heptosyltransferase
MHLLTTTTPINLGETGILPPGEWLVSDQNAAEIAIHAERGTWNLEYMPQECFRTPSEQATGKASWLIVRSGAWGDLLFMTAALRELRRQAPDISICLSCFSKHNVLFYGTGLVDEILPYPLPYEETERFDKVISLEDVIETNQSTHAVDCLAAGLGLDSVENYRPVYSVNPKEKEWAADNFPRTEHPRICIQPLASTPTRSYPLNLWTLVFKGLIANGWEVFVTGTPVQLARMQESPQFKKMALPFRQTAAFLDTCDAFCGVDSVWLHMADALQIPAVGLWGPVQWQVRSFHSKLTANITGRGECAPCHWYTHAGRSFPPWQPCEKLNMCAVLASIEPEVILQAIANLPVRPE